AWDNADRLRDAWQVMPPVNDHAWGPAAFGLDDEAYRAWRAWYEAATAADSALTISGCIDDDPDAQEDTKQKAEVAYERIDAIAGTLAEAVCQLPASPVACAAKLHIGLIRSGGYPSPADRDPLQALVEAVLADLDPHLPADMAAALVAPYRPGGAA
ncbi:MAG: hypothetical protein J0626_00165, partial [Rhodospirillaceae bacterium]|nr:hypothetical protein [Rhodospirillaceae bacterium]